MKEMTFSPIQICRNEKGFNVIEEGPVIIEGMEHYVKNGYVSCNASLNGRAWGITTKKLVCPECYLGIEVSKRKQLELFSNA